MTDVEILESWGVNVLTSNEFYTPDLSVTDLLEIIKQVRSDATMQGVKIWISMDETDSKTGGSLDADIWFGGDKPYLEGGIHYSQTSEHRVGVPRFVAQMFGLQPGQCKQFIVTEVQDGN